MGKRLSFDIEATVDDDIQESQVIDTLRSIMSDLERGEGYHEVSVISDNYDETMDRLVDILDNVDEEDIEKAIESIEAMEKDE